jgi:DNA-binding transcriptional regulator YiaG
MFPVFPPDAPFVLRAGAGVQSLKVFSMLSHTRAYESVAERRAKAERVLTSLMASTSDIKPLILNGSAICKGFWGKAWSSRFDEMADFGPRMSKGRSLVRNNAVCHLDVKEGQVLAKVSGDSLYNVTVSVRALAGDDWQDIKDGCGGSIHAHSDLMNGRLSPEAQGFLLDPSRGILPRREDVTFECGCHSGGTVCDHAAAALSGVANMLDSDPDLLFLLRGANPWELVSDPPDGQGPEQPGPLGEIAQAVQLKASDPSAPIIVRRRNGQESRLFPKDAPPAPAAGEPQAAEGGPEGQPRKKRAYRSRGPRRAKGKWVSLDVDAVYPDSEGERQAAPAAEAGQAPEAGQAAGAGPSAPEAPPAAAGAPGRAPEKAPSKARGRAPGKAAGAHAEAESLDRVLDMVIEKADDKAAFAAMLDSSDEGVLRRRAKGASILRDALTEILGLDAADRSDARTRVPQRAAPKAPPTKAARAAEPRIRKTMKTKTPATPTRPTKKTAAAAPPRGKKATAIPELDFSKITGKSIKAFRRHLGLSVEAFALKLDMCVATIRRWEDSSGRLALHTPSQEALRKLYNRQKRKAAREA